MDRDDKLAVLEGGLDAAGFEKGEEGGEDELRGEVCSWGSAEGMAEEPSCGAVERAGANEAATEGFCDGAGNGGFAGGGGTVDGDDGEGRLGRLALGIQNWRRRY